MCRFEPSYLAVTICKDYEISAKGHGVPHDKKRLDSAYCNRGQKCKVLHLQRASVGMQALAGRDISLSAALANLPPSQQSATENSERTDGFAKRSGCFVDL